MKIGVGGIADVNDVANAVLAEELGFADYWVGDNPMMWSDPYVTLALIAQQTERIRIGTGVAVSGIRSPEVTAAGMATVNALAPGRVVCGVGTGNTAMRVLGKRPMRIDDFDQWLAALRPLLAGAESTTAGARGGRAIIRHMVPDRGLVSFDPPVPLIVSAYGPRALGLAARYGDGLVGIGLSPDDVANAWATLDAAAERDGTTIDRSSFETSIITTMVVLEPGETTDSPRVLQESGAYAITLLHQAYEDWRLFQRPPLPFFEDIWDEYVAAIERVPAERRHLRIHEGHAFWVVPEEERFLSPELVDAVCMVGTADELVTRLRALEDAGLSEVVIIPPPPHKAKVIRDVGTQVLPQLAAASR